METAEQTLRTISITEIDFGSRKREDYGDLEKLASEISEVGLIHPLTVIDKTKIENKTGLDTIATNDNRYLLMAGGRRYTAWVDHELGEEIPCYVYPRILTADEIRKIELMENLSRKALTWQEDASMTNEIHLLEQKIHGKKHTSSTNGHGLKDTAELTGKSKSTVKNDIDLAQALKHIPELKNIKNKTEALKVVKQLGKIDKAETKATRVRKELSEKGEAGVKKELMNAYVLGDFFKHAEKLPDRTFDLIEIDPPYGIDLGNVKKGAKHTTLSYNEIPAKEYEVFMRRTLLYARKLIRPNGWLVVWYAVDPWHSMIARLMKETGFAMQEIPAIWIKNGGQTNRPKHYFGSCYEPFMYARAGDSSALNKGGSANYLIHPKIPPEQKFHPTHRPISLMEDVIERFIPDGKILIPFAGSGVTLRAAHNLGYKAIGYDLSEEYKNKHDAYVGEHETLKFEL